MMKKTAAAALVAAARKGKNKMSEKEQLQDMIEALTTLNIRSLDEESRDEAEYIVNDVIISLEELIDILPR
tara:strand:- start:1723 stop:1935 length:213 start_codon:yes stop_codon:yes gene_type:complete